MILSKTWIIDVSIPRYVEAYALTHLSTPSLTLSNVCISNEIANGNKLVKIIRTIIYCCKYNKTEQ